MAMVRAKRLVKHLEGTAPIPIPKRKPTSEEEARYQDDLEEFQAREAQVIVLIHAMVNESLMVEIQLLDRANDVWSVVRRRYENHRVSDLEQARVQNRQFQGEITPENIRAHFTEIRRVRNLLVNMGVDLGDEFLIHCVKRSMLSVPLLREFIFYSPRAIAVTKGKKRSVDAFMDTIQDYVEMMDLYSDFQSESCSGSAGGGRRDCFNCGRFGHLAKNCWREGGGREGQGPSTYRRC